MLTAFTYIIIYDFFHFVNLFFKLFLRLADFTNVDECESFGFVQKAHKNGCPRRASELIIC